MIYSQSTFRAEQMNMLPAFVQDRDDVVDRAKRAGVSTCIITGSSLRSSMRARDICSAAHDASLYFTAGVHPHEAKSCDDETLPVLRELAGHPCCCAIGECGLDFNRSVAFSIVSNVMLLSH